MRFYSRKDDEKKHSFNELEREVFRLLKSWKMDIESFHSVILTRLS